MFSGIEERPNYFCRCPAGAFLVVAFLLPTEVVQFGEGSRTWRTVFSGSGGSTWLNSRAVGAPGGAYCHAFGTGVYPLTSAVFCLPRVSHHLLSKLSLFLKTGIGFNFVWRIFLTVTMVPGSRVPFVTVADFSGLLAKDSFLYVGRTMRIQSFICVLFYFQTRGPRRQCCRQGTRCCVLLIIKFYLYSFIVNT